MTAKGPLADTPLIGFRSVEAALWRTVTGDGESYIYAIAV